MKGKRGGRGVLTPINANGKWGAQHRLIVGKKGAKLKIERKKTPGGEKKREKKRGSPWKNRKTGRP